MPYHPHSILAIDVSPFSRSLVMLPTMRALRAAYSKTFIIAAAPAGTVELLQAGELVDEAIDLGVVKRSGRDYAGSIKRLFRLMRQARRDQVDMVLDFSPRLETQLISRVARSGRVITPSRFSQVFEVLLGRSEKSVRMANHSDECANVLKQVGVKIEDARLAIELPEEENSNFERLLARHGSRGGELIVVLYGSKAGGTRGWPVENFGEMAMRLANNFGARIVAVDEPSDNGFTNSLEGLLPKGAIKLRQPRALELAAAIARASVFVTDDPGVATMGVEFTAPVLEVTDSPHRSSQSKTHRILYGASRVRITADEVYEIACEMLQEGRTVSLFRR